MLKDDEKVGRPRDDEKEGWPVCNVDSCFVLFWRPVLDEGVFGASGCSAVEW